MLRAADGRSASALEASTPRLPPSPSPPRWRCPASARLDPARASRLERRTPALRGSGGQSGHDREIAPTPAPALTYDPVARDTTGACNRSAKTSRRARYWERHSLSGRFVTRVRPLAVPSTSHGAAAICLVAIEVGELVSPLQQNGRSVADTTYRSAPAP